MPRHRRFRKRELDRQLARNIESAIREGSHRPGRSTELHREPGLRDPGELRLRLDDRDEPAGGFEPEGGGKRLLQQGARGHDGRPMSIGERGCRGSGALQVRDDEVETAPRDQHHRRVQDVLAGRAVMHEGRRIPWDRGAQGIDHRNHRIGAADRSPPELCNVELIDSAMTSYAVGRR